MDLNIFRAKETEEQKKNRLEKDRLRKKQTREQETPQQSADRLKKQREADRLRIQNETPQQRKTRLERDRLGHKSRLLMDPLKLEAIRKKIRSSKRSLTKKQR